jgi:hypothetical protein
MTFGTPSSAPFIENYASATAPLGPTSSNTYVNFVQASVFGATSSDEYQLGENGAIGLRGPQFSEQSIALDRFALPLAAVLTIFENLDLTSATTTTIYTVPTGKIATVLGCVIRIKAADTVSADADVSLGINPSTVNIFPTETLTAVQANDDIWSFWKDKSIGLLATSGQQVDIDVVTAATATTLTSDVYLIGLLI